MGSPLGVYLKSLVNGVADFDEMSAQTFYHRATYFGDSSHLQATSACTLFSGAQPGPVFTVNTTLDDTFDGVCSDIHCTLREAIEAANAVDGPNTIRFDIGVGKTITLSSKLPAIRAGGGLVLYRSAQRRDRATQSGPAGNLDQRRQDKGRGAGCARYV